ncbi:hypothetical protein LCGC14_0356150 [marine sediment metagenome]|uniref:Uncharacterized protein n=1 Tax=marine sediment metagenome TaxID=412755 RepID=A0A0F9WHL7_9ZZZZ
MKSPVRKPPAPPARKPPVSATTKAAAAPSKQFQVETWDTEKEGQRIILYADSGMGKTTICALLPNPKFVNFNGGSDKILHPVTGKRLQYIPGVETFGDVRVVCHQPGLFKPGDSFVLDTTTKFEDTGLDWTLENIPHEKGKSISIRRIEDYGWGKGYRHLYDTMRLPLADFDVLIQRGVNVVLSCQIQQIEINNASGQNYLCDVPKLQQAHGKNDNVPAVWALYNEWADHTFKIDYNGVQVGEGKAASTGERIIRVHGKPDFKAKSRSIPSKYPVVSFEHEADDSIWRMLFDEAWKEIE